MNIDVTISIHALLAESDAPKGAIVGDKMNFYPRSPCGERHVYRDFGASRPNFYPRSPCGERHLGAGKSCDVRHFYPRSPCGERPSKRYLAILGCGISIHALLAESDSLCMLYDTSSLIFLSTLSLRRATGKAVTTKESHRHFYPRSPCGERQIA